jgi:dTDP-4-dehydrorhamnose reductase
LNGFLKTIRKRLNINLKTLAVIGGNGMLGADLVEYLGPHFSVKSITKENYSEFINKSFDVLVNANGNSRRFWANENILEDFSLSTISVYNSLFNFKFSQYIYISSSDVYEKHNSNKYANEEDVPSAEALTPYGFHKYISELIVKKYAKNFLIIRPSMILGRKMKKGPIYDIMHNKTLFIPKESKLQMITTREISKIIHFLIGKKIANKIFNCGGKGTVSFKKINKYFSCPVKFNQSAGIQEYEMNVDKLNNTFPLQTTEKYLENFIESLTFR